MMHLWSQCYDWLLIDQVVEWYYGVPIPMLDRVSAKVQIRVQRDDQHLSMVSSFCEKFGHPSVFIDCRHQVIKDSQVDHLWT